MGASCCRPALLPHSEPMPPRLVCDLREVPTETLVLIVRGVSGLPLHRPTVEKIHISKSGYFVEISMLKHNAPLADMAKMENIIRAKRVTDAVMSSTGSLEFINTRLEFHVVDPMDKLRVAVYAAYARSSVNEGISKLIGETFIGINELIMHPNWELWMHDTSELAIFDRTKQETALTVQLDIDTEHYPANWARPVKNNYEEKHFARHVMVLTRGTRGDIQPFIALARGLAEQLNYMITIVTELSHKELITHLGGGLKAGCIRFRPSGGNTQARVDTPIAKWAVSNRSRFLQIAMLARSEAEFFDSEPAMYYWAKHMRPDLLMFGFCTANITMIASESLGIPMLGLVLQPTVIPSDRYPAVVPINSGDLETISKNWKSLNVLEGHKWVLKAKRFTENSPFSNRLNHMRKLRGLERFHQSTSDYGLIVKQNLPVIVPINPYAFGGKPEDWSENLVLTEYLFLRTGPVQNLNPELTKFIDKAKEDNAPLVSITFSSMPIERKRILELAFSVIEKAEAKPRIVAVIGKRPPTETTPDAIDEKASKLAKDGMLIEIVGAPFGKLFPLMDLNIVHGGLGTTAEALRAGVPTMVTGVLLMDQRFWGLRVHELGVGPEPVHINDLDQALVPAVNNALKSDSPWKAKAKEVASLIVAKKSDDGVQENIDAFLALSSVAIPVPHYGYAEAKMEHISERRSRSRSGNSHTGHESKSSVLAFTEAHSSEPFLKSHSTNNSRDGDTSTDTANGTNRSASGIDKTPTSASFPAPKIESKTPNSKEIGSLAPLLETAISIEPVHQGTKESINEPITNQAPKASLYAANAFIAPTGTAASATADTPTPSASTPPSAAVKPTEAKEEGDARPERTRSEATLDDEDEDEDDESNVVTVSLS